MKAGRLREPGQAWIAVAAAGALGSLLAWWLPAYHLDWQPALGAREPWRSLTAAWVHWSPMHLGANLLAAAVVAMFGWSARLPWPAAAAWALAWPATQCGLWLEPALAHYGGLSGVLHAAVAVGTVWLIATARGTGRRVGWAVFIGLWVKLALEAPWGPPLRHEAGWDIATAPLAHATGAVAGVMTAAAALLVQRWRARQSPA